MNIRLKELRLERGLKLKDVAEKLHVTIRTISRYEDGSREPSVDFIIRFCKLYEVSADYLLGLTDNY
ncbi:MAG: helix-turn-helix transcriptional regulator [Clostridia bacterium]|nr:helix-turn-helix transcriptional regulator [Clostridia bacterium]